MATKRNYAAEAAYKARPEQVKKRVENNRARREYEKIHGDLPSNVDVDHKVALSKGGTGATSNLQAVERGLNRSFSRTKTGAMKSQVSKREAKKK